MSFKRWTEPAFALPLLAGVVCLAYALYTNNIWEDWFITFRYSQNLVRGNGLVYNIGERVAGYSSPIGVLLPAFCYLVSGQSDAPAIWLYRIFSIAAFVGGIALLVRGFAPKGSRFSFPIFLLGFLFAFDIKAVAFSTNGLETGFMLLFLCWGIFLFQEGYTDRWMHVGLCWGGLLLTRPDGCIYIAILATVSILFCEGSRRPLLIALSRSAGVCALLYLPWFIWTWFYYGTPVPHTVIAKASQGNGPLVHLIQHIGQRGFWSELVNLRGSLFWAARAVFQPIGYRGDSEWYVGLERLTYFLGVFCGGYWTLPVKDRLGKMTSVSFALGCLYLTVIRSVSPWYMPYVAVFGIFTLARGVGTLTRVCEEKMPRLRIAILFLATALCVERFVLFDLNTWEMAVQQREIEFGNRKLIGLWLKDHVPKNDMVYLEGLGYLGYFSEAKIRDWPGLVSPEVVRLVKEEHLNEATVAVTLKPDWMVLRPYEIDEMRKFAGPFLSGEYELVKEFDVRDRLNRYSFLPGRSHATTDAVFQVFRRKRAPNKA